MGTLHREAYMRRIATALHQYLGSTSDPKFRILYDRFHDLRLDDLLSDIQLTKLLAEVMDAYIVGPGEDAECAPDCNGIALLIHGKLPEYQPKTYDNWTIAEELDARGWIYRRPKGVARSSTPPASHVLFQTGIVVAQADQSLVRDLYAAAFAGKEELSMMEVRSAPLFRMYFDIDGGVGDAEDAVLQTIHKSVAPSSRMVVCTSPARKHHLYFPETVVDANDARALRLRAIDALAASFPSHTWATIIDASVHRPKCGLRMPWSLKPGDTLKYVPTGLFVSPGIVAHHQPKTPREWLDLTSIRVQNMA